jgi:DnaJ like chaperone protein
MTMVRLLLVLLGLAYLACPYDLLPDFFAGLGWIDDLLLLALFWWYFFVYRKRRLGYKAQDEERQGAAAGEEAGREKQESGSRNGETSQRDREDPHSVLGVPRGASPEAIRSAYRDLANTYHPDKVSHLGEEFRELAEKRFKEIQEAYQELRPR